MVKAVAPEIMIVTASPETLEVEEGKVAEFTAAVEGAKGTPKYQWEVSTDGGENWVATGTTGNKTATMRININASRYDWLFRCTVTADNGTVSSNVVKAIKPIITTFTEEYGTYTITYTILDNGTDVSVTTFDGSATFVTIPTNPRDGYTVTEIGEEVFMGKGIVSIDLPNTITIIHARAFKNCSNLSAMNTHD